MKYKTYKEGLLMGSGAMEAAHRHVIQYRMKPLDYQIAQQVANIRVAIKVASGIPPF